jgi:hypothetical protein
MFLIRGLTRDRVVVAMLFLLVVAVVELPFLLRPHTVAGAEFLVGDPAYPLWLVDRLQQGKMLYRDAFSQYGPLSTLLYRAWSMLFTNSGRSFLQWQSLQVLALAALAWTLLRRVATVPWAALFLLAVLPCFLIGYDNLPYIGLERLAWMTLALAWRPVGRDSAPYLLAIGGGLAAMFLIKFGGGFLAFAAWVLTDIGLSRRAPAMLFRRWLLMGAGFLAVGAVWCAVLLAILPRPVAFDLIWPAYMIKNYGAYIGDSFPQGLHRWPQWIDLAYFLCFQLQFVAALALLPVLLVSVLKREDQATSTRIAPFLFLGLLFAVGLFIYFRHIWLIYDAGWILLLALFGFLSLCPQALRFAVLLLCLPDIGLCLHHALRRDPANFQEVAMPGGTIWMDPGSAARTENLLSVVNALRGQRAPPDRAVLSLPTGGGWSHYAGWPSLTRHTYFLVGFLNASDEAALRASLAHTAAVVLEEARTRPGGAPPSTDPDAWLITGGRHFSAETCAAFERYLSPPILVAGHYWVFPVKPSPENK